MDNQVLLQKIDELESNLSALEHKKDSSIKAQRDYNALVEGLEDLEAKSAGFEEQGQTGSAIWSEEIKAFIDGWTLKSLFYSEDWVYIVTDLVAKKISSQPLGVVRREVQRGQEILTPNASHELNEVFRNPNPWQDYHSWMYHTAVELALMGNDVIWWAEKNQQLTTLATELVSLDFDRKGELSRYLLSTESKNLDGRVEPFLQFKPSEIVHIRMPNPSSMLWGLSPFVPGRKSVLFNRYSTDYLNAFYLRQATPGLALKMDRQVNEDVALRQLRTFELAYSGRKNQRRTLILPKGVDVETLTHSLSDQKLVDMIDKNRETIINLFKVPKHELGIQKVGSLGSEEHRLALRNFWEATLTPMMRLIEGGLTKFFAKQLGPNNVIRFDTSSVDALQEDKLAKAALAKELLESGWSVNEVRRELFTKEASSEEDADRPYTLVRLDRNTAGLAPEVEEAPAEDEPSEENLAVLPSKQAQWNQLVQKQLDIELQTRSRLVEEDTLDLFGEIAERTVSQVVAAGEDQEGSALDLAALGLAIAGLTSTLKDAWVERNAQRLRETVELGYDQELDLVTDPTARNTLTGIRDGGLARRGVLLQDHLGRSFDLLSNTSTENVLKEIRAGVAAGENLRQIADRVVKFYDVPNAKFRAERIARTEVLTAASLGQWDAVEDAQKVIPGLKKQWLTVGDDRVRDSHDSISPAPIKVDAKFRNGLRFPRDPLGPASEVVNCRCTLVMIPPDGNF